MRRLFENFGVVTECDIMNKCGFVWMQTQEMAQDAIQALNNTQFKGQTIVVEPGRIKERNNVGATKRQGGGVAGGGRGAFNRGQPGSRGLSRGGGPAQRNQRGGDGGGPMRRGRNGPINRNTPYGGSRDFGGRQDFGSAPSYEPLRSTQSFGGLDGFSNEDRRGFALPAQYDSHVGSQHRGLPYQGHNGMNSRQPGRGSE